MDAITNLTLVGCFICLVLCVGTQTFLQMYSERMKWRWINSQVESLLERVARQYEVLDAEWNDRVQ